MKKRRSYLVGLFIVALLFILLAWYMGLVPVFNGPARAGVRHALGFRFLPWSVTVNAASTDAWTDYVFRGDISIHPADFEKLLAARNYEMQPFQPSEESLSESVDGRHPGFHVAETWVCSYSPPPSRLDDHGTTITLETNAERNRVFILYGTD